jgi:soluble lytic murein transglycosylase
VRQFGGADFALATYNAGPSRVARWISERPGLPREEFIDDIPFPETQDYVKKIISQAEDYRRLYGPGAPAAVVADDHAAADRPAAADQPPKSATKKAPAKAKTPSRKSSKA